MKFIKPLIINEKYGVNDSVKEYTDYVLYRLSQYNIKEIVDNYDEIKFKINGDKEDFQKYVSQKSYLDFPIINIIIIFKFKKSDTTKVANANLLGISKLERTEISYNDLNVEKKACSIQINLNIYVNDYEMKLTNVEGLDYGIQHELHHAFERYNILYKGAGDENMLLKDEYIDFFVKEFKKRFKYNQQVINIIMILYYMSNHEINARISQLEKELKNKNLKDTQAYKDYMILVGYNKDEYTKNIKDWLGFDSKKFINDWNELSNDFNNKVKPINKIEDIFNRYDKQIKEARDKFKRRMYRLK